MKHLTHNHDSLVRRASRFLFPALLALATLGATGADAQVLDFTIEQGFDVSETVPVPHVFCRNATPGSEEYARSDVYSAFGNAPAYTRWRCWSGGLEGLQTQPVYGDLIEQKIHGKSDGFDPEVDILSGVTVSSVVCRNTSEGDVTVGSEDSISGNWFCNLPSPGYSLSAGDDVIMIIDGNY